MDKSQELQLLKLLDSGGLNKSQEFNVLKALEGDISADEAMRDVYLESLKPSLSFDELVDSKRTDKSSDSEMFDTETGITDSSLRRQLGGAESAGEEELVLKNFGFREGDYIRDKRGNLALTPNGALLLDIVTDKPIMIDESQFSISDIQDFVGAAGEEIVGGIAGAVAGQALIPVPILGAMIGAGIGIGMLTYATAEPIYHFVNNPDVIRGITSGETLENVRPAFQWSFLHWGLSAWACYALVGLTLFYKLL